VNELYTDGGFNSPTVDALLNDARIEHFQTAIRGQPPDDNRVTVSDFSFTRDENGTPQAVRCPGGQDTDVVPAHKPGRFTARFDADACAGCPLLGQCPTERLKRKPQYRILRFDQQQVNVAHRRANQRQAQASGQNLRSAVEATVRSVKHPFGNHTLPVRGHIRVSLTMVASAAMVNVRRIWCSQMRKNEAQMVQSGANTALQRPVSLVLRAARRVFFCLLDLQAHARAAAV
jgi:hypothetical protein